MSAIDEKTLRNFLCSARTAVTMMEKKCIAS